MADLTPVERWLLTEARLTTSVPDLVRRLFHTLRRAGVAVDRGFYGSTVLHPQVAALLCRWDIDSDVVTTLQWSPTRFAEVNQDRTPLGDLRDSRREVRYPLHALDDHPYEDIRLLLDAGYTDYVLLPVLRGDTFEGGLNFCTRQPGGFSPAEHAALTGLVPAICCAMDRVFADFLREQLLCAYLGRDAGRRVYAGQVRLGDRQTVQAAIWFSDLRGYTRLSESRPPEEVIAAINDAFEVVVDAIQTHDGEVLKFMGDGVLGIFIDAGEDTCCDRALLAAQQTQRRLADLRRAQRADGRPETHVGVGLHYGDVTYGNIGAEGRLDFTVVGRAVNLAARIEALCGSLERTVLASEAVAGRVQGGALALVARRQVKGVAEPVAVFGVNE